MTHVEEGVLQAYLDAEVTASARAEIDKHLQSCSACVAELHRLRSAAELFSTLVRQTDVAVPVVIAPMAAAPSPVVAPPSFELERKVPRPRPRRALARAAMFIVGLAAVASATVPGSPVRGWINAALTRAGLLDAPQSAAAPEVNEEAPAAERAPDITPIGIEPVNGRARVILTNIRPPAAVKIEETDGGKVEVVLAGRANRARVSVNPGRLSVNDVTGGVVTVRIPRTLQHAVVEQDGITIYTKGR
jgi:hypothetical protein